MLTNRCFHKIKAFFYSFQVKRVLMIDIYLTWAGESCLVVFFFSSLQRY